MRNPWKEKGWNVLQLVIDRNVMTLELVGRPNQKMDKSHNFFKQTKISTCSYIYKEGNEFKARPYYYRPKQLFEEYMNKYQ